MQNVESNRQTGFTLIELLVVVAIIGIVTTLLTVNIGSWLNTPNTEAEAKRLIINIHGLLDQAVISQIHLGLVVKQREIVIYQRQDEEWQALQVPQASSFVISEGIKLLAPVTTPPPATAEGEPAQPPITIHLGTDGRMTAYRLGIEDGETRCYLVMNSAGGIQVDDCERY